MVIHGIYNLNSNANAGAKEFLKNYQCDLLLSCVNAAYILVFAYFLKWRLSKLHFPERQMGNSLQDRAWQILVR